MAPTPASNPAPRRTHLLLSAALLGTVLMVALGAWVLSRPPASASEHLAPQHVLDAYLGPSQLSAGQKVSLPAYADAPAIRESYQFAVERPDVLRYLPCYCGCALEAGHRSNLDCFVQGVDEAGGLVFDEHAAGCQVCVDIALDARRLVAEGKSLPEVRQTVDRNHSQKGPGTDTPLPPG